MSNPTSTPVDLHAQIMGKGLPIVFLHGLFGSWQNLGTAIRAAAEHYEVHALDLRNHGKSPHSPRHDYPALASDVASYIDQKVQQPCYLLGHSMGGKTAMHLALSRPDLVAKLLVVDIAPRAYPPHHDEILEGLEQLQGQHFNNRTAVDVALTHWVPDVAVRSFLLKNLKQEDGIVHWKMNLPTIVSEYAHIAGWPESHRCYEGPSMFFKGAESDYITAKDQTEVLRLFPHAQLKVIASTGHWPHAEKTKVFNKLMLDFLSS